MVTTDDWLDMDLDDLPPASVWDDITAMEEGFCCFQSASADGDVERCTCWEPVYDHDTQHRPMIGLPPVVRPAACWDCAYRPDSAERAHGEGEALESLPHGRGMFFCHDGIRRAVAYRHQGTGLVRPAGYGDYQPPIVNNGGDRAPYRADGLPAFVCAGWANRHRAAGTPELIRSTTPPVFFCH